MFLFLHLSHDYMSICCVITHCSKFMLLFFFTLCYASHKINMRKEWEKLSGRGSSGDSKDSSPFEV